MTVRHRPRTVKTGPIREGGVPPIALYRMLCGARSVSEGEKVHSQEHRRLCLLCCEREGVVCKLDLDDEKEDEDEGAPHDPSASPRSAIDVGPHYLGP
jgi:hypothetical protein